MKEQNRLWNGLKLDAERNGVKNRYTNKVHKEELNYGKY